MPPLLFEDSGRAATSRALVDGIIETAVILDKTGIMEPRWLAIGKVKIE